MWHIGGWTEVVQGRRDLKAKWGVNITIKNTNEEKKIASRPIQRRFIFGRECCNITIKKLK